MAQLSQYFENQPDNTPQVNPLQALLERNKKIQSELEDLKAVKTPRLSDPSYGPDDPESMSTEVLRGLFSTQIPNSQDPKFGEVFRQSISPAREVLANMFNGISASMLGTKFRSVRDQAFEQYATEKKLSQEQQQIQQTLKVQAAQLATKVLQDRRDDETRRAIENVRSSSSDADRAEKLLSLQERVQSGQINIEKFLTEEKDKEARLSFEKEKEKDTGDPLWDASRRRVEAALAAKGVKTDTPEGYNMVLQGTKAEWENALKFKASLVKKGTGKETNYNGLVNAVLSNPDLFNRLTATQIGAIAPDLARNGFNNFGKPLGEGAINKLAESRSAINSLQELRDVLVENKEFIGPLKGFAAVNPFNTKARIAQAKIDLVRQRVGKALEGGVLRKEDEEKYKKILATLRDQPETAIAKVDGLISTLGSDMKTFMEEQRAAGRAVNSPAPSTSGIRRYNPATGKIE